MHHNTTTHAIVFALASAMRNLLPPLEDEVRDRKDDGVDEGWEALEAAITEAKAALSASESIVPAPLPASHPRITQAIRLLDEELVGRGAPSLCEEQRQAMCHEHQAFTIVAGLEAGVLGERQKVVRELLLRSFIHRTEFAPVATSSRAPETPADALAMAKSAWACDDSTEQAEAEGWQLEQVEGAPVRIACGNELQSFDTDEDAIEHVYGQAMKRGGPNGLHRRAITLAAASWASLHAASPETAGFLAIGAHAALKRTPLRDDVAAGHGGFAGVVKAITQYAGWVQRMANDYGAEGIDPALYAHAICEGVGASLYTHVAAGLELSPAVVVDHVLNALRSLAEPAQV